MGMKKGMVVACAVAVVSILSLITVILGIAGVASAAQSVVSDDNRLSCEYHSSAVETVGCGVVAALMALTTQILASAATGCCGCCRTWGIPSEAKRIVAVILSTFSWVLSIIVVILFWFGAVASRPGWDLLTSDDNGKCVPPGTVEFAAATILFLISVVFQITSYILLQATALAGSTKPLAQESGIAMGQPAEPVDNAEQKAAAAGGPPPSAPTASSEANVAPAPPLLSTMAPKANSDSTSHV